MFIIALDACSASVICDIRLHVFEVFENRLHYYSRFIVSTDFTLISRALCRIGFEGQGKLEHYSLFKRTEIMAAAATTGSDIITLHPSAK